MSGYQWQVGDKATVGSCGMGEQGDKIVITEVEGEYLQYFNKTRGVTSCFSQGATFAKDLKPRGKKTKARYNAATLIHAGDWVEFIENYTPQCIKGTKVKGTGVESDASWTLIRYDLPNTSGTGSLNSLRVKKCEAPAPVVDIWEGYEYGQGKGVKSLFRSKAYLDKNNNRDNYNPVRLEDVDPVDLIAQVKSLVEHWESQE